VSFDAPAGAPRTPVPDTGPRRRGILLPLILTLGALVFGFLIFAGFYTDVLWFQSVGKTSVFSTTILTRLAIFVVAAAVMIVIVGGSMYLAWRVRPVFRSVTPEQISLERYRAAIEPFRGALLFGLPAALGVLAGLSASAEWRTWMQFRNSAPFGNTDVQFGLDLSYYSFVLPFQRFVLSYLITAMLLALLGVFVVHYLYGGINLVGSGQRITRAATVQFAVMLGVIALLKAASYWLDRYELVIGRSSLHAGAGYTAVSAQLPSLTILTFVALVVAVLFFVAAIRGGLGLAALGLGLMFGASAVIGGLYPAFVQQFQVRPSVLVKEAPFIERNLEATRKAYGLDGVKPETYDAKSTPTKNTLTKDSGTLSAIRVLDPTVVARTYTQVQSFKSFYSFQDSLDVDRYTVDGKQRGAVVAVRELNLNGLSPENRSWATDHLIYTHGFGFVAAYDNTATSEGQPQFFESELPPQGKLDVKQPRIYFGESSPAYSIVGAPEGSSPTELDYPDDKSANKQQNTTYTGSGGVPIGSLFNRLVFAVQYQEPNILLSDLVNSESRILYNREPLDRIEKIAPWLTLDRDPYPAVIDGKVQWIVDGYTTSNSYPYAERTSLADATTDSITQRTQQGIITPVAEVNYIRNSVKATVDAYDGTVTLYEWDEKDPVLKTWQSSFPGTVTPRAEIPESLLTHLRYPEDLFKVQREILSRYHVTDAASFLSGQDFWGVPDDPTKSASVPQPPYYLTLRMPDQETASFQLTTTFVPNGRTNLAAFMAVNSEPGPDYGQFRVLQLPRNTTVPGPGQVQANFTNDPKVAGELNILKGRGGGTEVEYGNLLSLPVGGGLLYVEPVYIRSTTGTAIPSLRKVLASFGGVVAFEDTLEKALAVVLKENATNNNGGGTVVTPPVNQTPTQKAIAAAQQAYIDGQKALARGDFTAYGEAQKRLNDALAVAAAASSGSPVPTPTESGATPAPTGSGDPSAIPLPDISIEPLTPPSPTATDGITVASG